MRVTSTSSRSASGPRRTKSGGKGGFAIAGKAGGVTSTPSGALGVLSSIDALGVLQGLDAVADAATPAEQAVAHGDALLGALDGLRDSLLRGLVDRQGLRQLQHGLREQRAPSGDPRLETILDDIELRVAVELAKAERDDPAAEGPMGPTVIVQDAPLSAPERAQRARQAYAPIGA